MYSCMHPCTHGCKNAGMVAGMDACKDACMDAWIYAWMQVCMHRCMHVWMHAWMHAWMQEGGCMEEGRLMLGWCFERCLPKSPSHFFGYHFGTHFWFHLAPRVVAIKMDDKSQHELVKWNASYRRVVSKSSWVALLRFFVKSIFHHARLISVLTAVFLFFVGRPASGTVTNNRYLKWNGVGVEHFQ